MKNTLQYMGNVLKQWKAYCPKKVHIYIMLMPCVASQCTAYTPFSPEKIMIPHMEKRIQKISREISVRKNRSYPHMSPITRKLYPKLMIPYMKVEHEYDKGFYTNEKCLGCAVCSKVCPTQNITMQGNRPVWHHRCHGCMACVAYCPTKAIPSYEELGTIISKRLCLPEKRKRYHNPFIQATDLMQDRRCIHVKKIEVAK